ncbi:ABC transporter permease subunit [Allomesorhizobium camelthorni]|uniref:ABC transporter permease subunit n=1 Tax=Allomesorhizobium camelthorni TaxID=475069 RepID=A0A6G4WNJ2_9HYPH|nr:ABC transporter permease subunit [Mesorhizobium camelthorni]NGO55670.1 ABC transporter permease subunit [Mesorhizobium camelthorni]
MCTTGQGIAKAQRRYSVTTLCSVSELAWKVVPIWDLLQTIPLLVFLTPMLMFFQIGEFPAFLAICAYAIVPMIRYTHHELTSTPNDLIEAAVAAGASESQIMREIRIPARLRAFSLGVNQTIMYSFAMLVIAALIGNDRARPAKSTWPKGQANVGLGIAAGFFMAVWPWSSTDSSSSQATAHTWSIGDPAGNSEKWTKPMDARSDRKTLFLFYLTPELPGI